MQQKQKRERAPTGIERRHPISMRLKPAERQRLEAAAAAANQTLNAMARRAVLAGLDHVDGDAMMQEAI